MYYEFNQNTENAKNGQKFKCACIGYWGTFEKMKSAIKEHAHHPCCKYFKDEYPQHMYPYYLGKTS